MTKVVRRFSVEPHVLYEWIVDAERYPEWLVGARRVVIDDPAWPRPDTSFHHEVGVGPVTVHDSTSVSDVDPDHRLHLVVRARPFLVADVDFELTPAEGAAGGTDLTMTETPRGSFRLLAPAIAPVVRLRNAKSLANLETLVTAKKRD